MKNLNGIQTLILTATLLSSFTAFAVTGPGLRALRGGASSGTPAEYQEVTCASDDGEISANILQDHSGERFARVTVGSRAYETVYEMKRTLPRYPGTPGEKPLRYTTKDFGLNVWMTAAPMGDGYNERSGEVTLTLKGKTKTTEVVCQVISNYDQ